MKFLLGILLTAGLCFGAQSFLPWWSMALAAFIVGLLLGAKWLASFGFGFLGVGLLWGIYAYTLDAANGSLLSRQMGELFKGLDANAVLLATALVGGLVGGFAALSGSTLRSVFRRKKAAA
jgi:hypothetical protein